jgi:hypothetical protein
MSSGRILQPAHAKKAVVFAQERDLLRLQNEFLQWLRIDLSSGKDQGDEIVNLSGSECGGAAGLPAQTFGTCVLLPPNVQG